MERPGPRSSVPTRVVRRASRASRATYWHCCGGRAQAGSIGIVRGRRPKPLPLMLLGLTLLAEIVAVALSAGLEPTYDTWMYALWAVIVSGTGALIASRHPENPIGWLFCGFALFNAVGDVAQGWGLRAAVEGWPGGAAGEWIATWIWLPSGLGLDADVPAVPRRTAAGPRLEDRAVDRRRRHGAGDAGWSLTPDRDADFASGRNPLAVACAPDRRAVGRRDDALPRRAARVGRLAGRCASAARAASSASSSSGSRSRPRPRSDPAARRSCSGT